MSSARLERSDAVMGAAASRAGQAPVGGRSRARTAGSEAAVHGRVTLLLLRLLLLLLLLLMLRLLLLLREQGRGRTFS